jgi:branched-chain amino acid transport system ATP-binding protein
VSLAVRDLAVSFGGVAALGGVSFEAAAGSITSLIGPNGAGKTTAFDAITGFVRPDRGEILYEGAPLGGLRPCEVAGRGVVRTFQKTSVFPQLTVVDNVLIGLHLQATATLGAILLGRRRVRDEETRIAARAADILAFVGLEPRAATSAGGLAYGEQRLLELAIALAAGPRLLLLDEPAAGMTGAERVAVVGLIRQIRDRGVTLLLVEHDMRLVMGVSDHVVVLSGGRVIAAGPPDAVRGDPEVVRVYLGAGPADP